MGKCTLYKMFIKYIITSVIHAMLLFDNLHCIQHENQTIASVIYGTLGMGKCTLHKMFIKYIIDFIT